jgi:tRNA (mo5U34)-methyltransferase
MRMAMAAGARWYLAAVSSSEGRRSLEAEVAARQWYHTLELAPGLVTPGMLDTRQVADRVSLPASLTGARCLDVGTFNGFWAFEMERRGAEEVVAIDVLDPERWDWPVGSDDETVAAIGRRQAGGSGFELAKRALGSGVRRLDRSVYDLDEREDGRFDLVYLGSLLIHLRDPVGALERIRGVCGGTLVVVDGIDLPLSLLFPRPPIARLDGRGRPWWWQANAAGVGRMLEAAGFEVVEGPRRLFIPPGRGWPLRRGGARALATREGRYELVVAWKGDPHASFVARPRGPGGR